MVRGTLIKHCSPHGTDGVHSGHPIDVGVGVGVGCEACRVRIGANSSRRVVNPGSHRVVLRASVGGLQADGGGHEITPALAHTARFKGVQAVGVGRAAGESGGDTVSVLMDDNGGVETGISLGGRSGPDVHAHARVLAIRGGCEVRVVGSRAILGVQNDFVVATPAGAVDICLKVACSLVETENVE